MAGEWLITTIGAQATLQRGIDITKADQRIGSVPVVSSGGVSSFHDTATAEGPGVVLGRKGVVGSVYYIETDYWPHDTSLWVKDFHGNDRRFVYYFFRWMAPLIATMDVGSANPTLNRNHVHPIEVRWPPLPEQQAIAAILGALDDKIELNRRMNETLEGMARALFKSWFVDFDPVRAKAAGQQLKGLKPEIAALFPDSFEDSELGEIPKGWKYESLGECVSKVSMGPFGSSIKTDNFVDEGVPIIRGSNLTKGFVEHAFVYLTELKADELKNANAFPGDIVITHRGTLGQIGLIPARSRFPRYVVSQSQMLVRPDPAKLPSHYLYLSLTSPQGQQALLSNTSQTGVPAIAQPTSSVKALSLIVPKDRIAASFEKVVGSHCGDGIVDCLTHPAAPPAHDTNSSSSEKYGI